MSELNGYISAINSRCTQGDGDGLARLLRIPPRVSVATPDMLSLSSRTKDSANIVHSCEARITFNGIGTIAGNRICAMNAVFANDWAEANRCAIAAYICLLDIFKEDDENWLIPVLNTVSNDLRLLSTEVKMTYFVNVIMMCTLKADKEMKNRDNEFLRDALRNLTNGFNTVARDRYFI
jgi:hypothetical protein